MSIDCRFCDRTDFPNQRSLSQHQQRNSVCYARLLESFGADSGYTTAREFTSCICTNAGRNHTDVAQLPKYKGMTSGEFGAMLSDLTIQKQKKIGRRKNAIDPTAIKETIAKQVYDEI